MLESVKTPLLSGIPYMFRFAAPRTNPATTIGEDRKLMQWVPSKIEDFESIGLKSRYSQAIFNPASLACLGMILVSFMIKTFLTTLVDAQMSYEYLHCSVSSLEGTHYGTFYHSAGVMQILHQSNTQAIEQYMYSVNATLWNLQTSSHQYAGLLGAYYQTLETAVPGAAYLASANVSRSLGYWAHNELENCSKYTNKLLHDIDAAMGELGGSSGNATNNISSAIPTGLNSNLSKIWDHGPKNLYNLTHNTMTQLDVLFATAATNISEAFAHIEMVSANISIIPSVFQTSGCLAVISQYQRMVTQLRTQFNLQAALFSLMSVVFTGLSALYTNRKWLQRRVIVNEMCTRSHSTPKKAINQLHKYETLIVGYLQSGLDKYPGKVANSVKWLMGYFLSSFMVTLLSVGWMFIILSLCVSSMLKVANQPVLVDLATSLPHENLVDNSTLTISPSSINSQLAQIEQNINANVTGILTNLVTSVNSIIYTVNGTMNNFSAQTLQSLNLTAIPQGLDFHLIYENGIAMQEITLCRVPLEINSTIGVQNIGIFDPAYGFGTQNISGTGLQVQAALRITGLAMVLTWLGALTLGTIYISSII